MSEETKLSCADVDLLRTNADLRLRCLKLVEDKYPNGDFGGKLIQAQTLFEFATQGLQPGASDEENEEDDELEILEAAAEIDDALQYLHDSLIASQDATENLQRVLAKIAEEAEKE